VLAEPKVLLLDEPFTGLDLHVKEEIAHRLFSFAETHGASIIFVTHDLYDACEYAGKVIILNGRSPATIGAIVNTNEKGALDLVRNLMLRPE